MHQPVVLCATDSSSLTRGVLMNALATVGMPRLPMLTSALTSRLSNLTATLDSSTPALRVQVGRDGTVSTQELRQARAVCMLSATDWPQRQGTGSSRKPHMSLREGLQVVCTCQAAA